MEKEESAPAPETPEDSIPEEFAQRWNPLMAVIERANPTPFEQAGIVAVRDEFIRDMRELERLRKAKAE